MSLIVGARTTYFQTLFYFEVVKMENKIKEYFTHHKLNPSGIRNFLCYTEGVRDWVSEQIKKNPEYQSPGGYIICLLNNIELPKCQICNNKISYKQFRNNRRYCSMKCSIADNKTIRKYAEETNLRKYGVRNCSSLDGVKAKRKKTLLEKYGVENITQNKEYVKKAKETMLKKYGVENVTQIMENKKSRHVVCSFYTGEGT